MAVIFCLTNAAKSIIVAYNIDEDIMKTVFKTNYVTVNENFCGPIQAYSVKIPVCCFPSEKFSELSPESPFVIYFIIHLLI